jgi:ParB/RepB/Spo0J family partition protein
MIILLVPLSQIEDNPFQKRQIYDQIEELAADILSHQQSRPDTLGLQQIPVGRLADPDDGMLVPMANLDTDDWLVDGQIRSGWRVQLEFGHRRKRAFDHICHNLHIHEYHQMPVYIRDLTDDQMLDGVWSENRQRRDLSAVEEAELLRDKLERLQANGGGSQREVAEAWGLARPTVANRLRLLDLPPEIQQANREGKLSERQCLALATVVKIGEVAGDYADWGKSYADYGYPAAPAVLIAHAIDNADKFTSDDIRRYTDRALRQAGTELPKTIANSDFTGLSDGDGLHSYTCKGCRYRHHDTCLKRPCLETKKSMYGQQVAKKAAEELNLPYSNVPAHFSPYMGWKGDDERAELKTVHQADVSDQVVIGFWLDHGTALRPCHDDDYLNSGSMWDNDGKGLVVMGHRTPIDRELLAMAQAALMDAAEAGGEEIEIEDIPERFELEEWEKEAKKIVQRLNRRAKTAVLDRLSYEVADSTTIQALVRSKSEDWLDPEAFLKKFMGFLWDKGNGVPYYHSKADEIEALGTVLDRAEIGRAILWESEVERLTVAAIFVLTWYYARRGWGKSLYHLKEARDKLQPVREEFDNHRHEPDLATWSYELDRAWRDVQSKLEAAEGAESGNSGNSGNDEEE